MQTIGLLLPRSTYYAGIGFDIFEGLKASLEKHAPDEFSIATENIGFGTDKQQCYRAAEQLIMHHDARIVFAYISHRIAQLLRPLFTAANRTLIVLDSGASLPQEWPSSPNIFFLSLHNSLGTMLSTRIAAKDGYKKGGVVTGYYDGGYLHTFAAYQGFTEAGGELLFNHATGYTREDFSMLPLAEQMKNNPGSCILGLFSGDYTQWFFEELAIRQGDQQFPVYLAPFSLEETMLGEIPWNGQNAKGVAAWLKSLPSEENSAFVAEVENAGRTPNLFSLLGWEAGQVSAALLKAGTNLKNAKEITQAMRNLSITTPRGSMTFAGNHSSSPMYSVHLQETQEGTCGLALSETLTGTEEAFTEMSGFRLQNAVSGWFNSYTCI